MRTGTLAASGFFVFLLLLPLPARSQYIYLDTNGNGVHDENDRLAPEGPTAVDIWLVTDHKRDGTPVVCNVDAGVGLTMNSYTVILHAIGGEVDWGPMQNRIAFTTPSPVCFANYADTTGGGAWYHNGWGWMDVFPPGTYHLATLTVTRRSGNPSIFFEPFSPTNGYVLTCFGTKCPTTQDDNTYRFGTEWGDAQGAGSIQAVAGGPYLSRVGFPVSFYGGGSRTPNGTPMTYRWDFGDGTQGSGAAVNHTYISAGQYAVTLTVDDGVSTSTSSTEARILLTNQPVALAGGPYSGYVGRPITMDGRASRDPDGDPLHFTWSFGDGSQEGTESVVTHTYSAAGTYLIKLKVSDTILEDTDDTSVNVRLVSHPPTADAGGPYSGIVGRTIIFSGGKSYDPDGDALKYEWGFGDRTYLGLGVISGHAYEAPGEYQVELTVNDGETSASARTTASIAAALPARAFSEGHMPIVVLDGKTPLVIHIEPASHAFEIEEVDPYGITLRSEGTGSVGDITVNAENAAFLDSDGNGVKEMTVVYGAEDLARLFGGIGHPSRVQVSITGGFFRGGAFLADWAVQVQPATSGILRISPNPFNPEAIVRFWTSKPGAVRADLFDVRGRMVRTLLDEPTLNSGPHEITLDARNAGGEPLASGVYFFRLIEPGGTSTKRVAVAK